MLNTCQWYPLINVEIYSSNSVHLSVLLKSLLDSQEQEFLLLPVYTQIRMGEIFTVYGSLQLCWLGRLPYLVRVAFTQAGVADNWYTGQNSPSSAHGRHC